MKGVNLYSFVYQGILTDECLDKNGRKKHRQADRHEIEELRTRLSIRMLDRDLIAQAEISSVAFIAMNAFENSVRAFVSKAMAEFYDADWWDKVSASIKKKVQQRKEDEAKVKWHSSRGTADIFYCDFGDLQGIIISNWDAFSEVLREQEWVKPILTTLERSRNVIMHGGELDRQDYERIGIHIRDWIRQTG